MNIEKYLPLTETTFYILISLIDSGHGYNTMQKIESISNEGSRRKVYRITSLGLDVLKQETKRLKYLVGVAEKYEFK